MADNQTELSIAFTVKSKCFSVNEITNNVGQEPDGYADAGEKTRTLPSGKITQTSLQTWTTWTKIFSVNECDIEKKILDVISLFAPSKFFLEDVVSKEGVAEIQIRSQGDCNFGDVFSQKTLKKLSDLGVSLSIEVF